MRTPEQLNDHGILQTTRAQQTTTSIKQEQKPKKPQSKSKCHSQYEFTCKTSGACIPIYDVCNTFFDCDDKTDEADCEPLNHRKVSNYENPELKNKAATDKTDSISVNDLKGNVVSESKVEFEKDPAKDTDESYIEAMRPEFKVNSDYDYDSLLLKQAEILAHLKEVEDADKASNNRQRYKTPDDLFDSYMRTRPNQLKITSKRPYVEPVRTTKKTPKKILWNGKKKQ